MSKTHQQENANFFKKNQAAVILDQNELIKNKNLIVKEIKKALRDKLKKMLKKAGQKISCVMLLII